MTGSGEGVDQLGANFVATGADARANRDDKVFRFCTELARERRHRGACGASRRSAPAGVHGGDNTSAGISQEKRHTVRRAHGNRNIGIVRDQNIGVLSRRSSWGPSPGGNDLAAVDLVQPDDLRDAEQLAGTTPVVDR